MGNKVKDFKGIDQDRLPEKLAEGSYSFALNAVSSEKYGSVSGEKGNTLQATITGRTIIGVITTGDEFIVFSVNSANTDSEIGVFRGGDYTRVIDTGNIIQNMGFRLGFPITGEFYFNQRQECIVGFRANNIRPRVFNIGQLSSPRLTSVDSDNDTLMFPETRAANISLSLNNTGGSLSTGSVQITYRYEDNDGTLTNYMNISSPLSITSNTTPNFNDFSGDLVDVQTGKSLGITLNGLDTRFRFVRLFAIVRRNAAIEVRMFRRLPITMNTISTVYTGSEVFQSRTLDEVLVRSQAYSRIETLSNYSNRLYAGNLESDRAIDFQRTANNIRINYTSKVINALEINASQKINPETGFTHSEVYAFYIVLRYRDGTFSQAYHIPGRAALPSDRVTTNPDLSNIQRYRIDDTTDSASQTYTTSQGVRRVVQKNLSNMGFWENSNEVYPDDQTTTEGQSSNRQFTLTGNNGFLLATSSSVEAQFEITEGETYAFNYLGNREVTSVRFSNNQTVLVLQGTESEFDSSGNNNVTIATVRTSERLFPNGNVRHHRFPSVRATKSQHYSTDAEYGKTRLDILGIEASNVIIDAETLAKLDEGSPWFIAYAKREYNNSTVHSQSLLHNLVTINRTPADAPLDPSDEIRSTGGNWVTDFNGDEAPAQPFDGTRIIQRHYKFLSPAVFLDTPSFNNYFLRTEYTLSRAVSITTTIEGGSSVGAVARNNLVDYTASAETTVNFTDNSNYTVANWHRINQFAYISLDTRTVEVNNIRVNNIVGEPYAHLFTDKDLFFNGLSLATGTGGLPGDSAIALSFMTTAISLRTDCYESLFNQDLVDTGTLNSGTSSGVIYGGDAFVVDYSYKTMGRNAALHRDGCGIPGYRARIRPIVSRITIHWPSFYNVVTGKTLALPNLIALQHIPLSPAGVIAKRPAPIALPNSCAAEWRMAPDAVFSPYASVRYFTPHMVHSQYNLL